MRLDAFIINMPEAVKRRSFISAQLENFPELNPIIFEAINGKNLDSDDINKKYDAEKAKKIFGRTLSLSEIGCTLSHLSVYNTVIDKKLPYALVLEDDVLISSYLSDVLPDCLKAMEEDKPMIFLLTPIFSYKNVNKIKIGKRYENYAVLGPQHYLYPIWSVNYCAAGYIINKAACKVILKDQNPLHSPIDNWEYLSNNKIVDIRALIPYVISFSSEGRNNSIIDKERKCISMSKAKKRNAIRLLRVGIQRRINKVCKTDREIF
jgi:glycosyl transferase, family 25